MITLNAEGAAALSGKSVEELESLITEWGDKAPEEFGKLVVDKFKKIELDRAKNSYNRGVKEKGEALERALEPILKKHGITGFETVEAAAQELAEKLKSSDGGKPAKAGDPQNLTAEELRKLPAFQQALDDIIAGKDAELSRTKAEFDAYRQNTEREKLSSSVLQKSRAVLEKAGAANLTDENLHFTWKALGYDNLAFDEKGDVALMKDGEPMRDDAGNRITFDKFVSENWRFGFNDAPAGGSPGKPGRAGAGGDGLPRFASEGDYLAAREKAGLKERVNIDKGWAASIREQGK